jgi:hypothetical protein
MTCSGGDSGLLPFLQVDAHERGSRRDFRYTQVRFAEASPPLDSAGHGWCSHLRRS